MTEDQMGGVYNRPRFTEAQAIRCAYCQELFHPRTFQRKPKYCSKACEAAKRRNERRGKRTESR